MRVLVVYENAEEQKIADLLASAAATAVGRELNWAVARLNTHRPPLSVRTMSYRELFSGCTEYERNAYMQALERAVFVE